MTTRSSIEIVLKLHFYDDPWITSFVHMPNIWGARSGERKRLACHFHLEAKQVVLARRRLHGIGVGGLYGMSFPLKKGSSERNKHEMLASVWSWLPSLLFLLLCRLCLCPFRWLVWASPIELSEIDCSWRAEYSMQHCEGYLVGRHVVE